METQPGVPAKRRLLRRSEADSGSKPSHWQRMPAKSAARITGSRIVPKSSTRPHSRQRPHSNGRASPPPRARLRGKQHPASSGISRASRIAATRQVRESARISKLPARPQSLDSSARASWQRGRFSLAKPPEARDNLSLPRTSSKKPHHGETIDVTRSPHPELAER